MRRKILHFHIPALPIAVARVSRPELRDRPVAAAADRSGRSRIISASREARREGVFKGMSLQKARACCPGLKVIPPHAEAAEKACQALARAAARYTPRYEPSRPGHLYLDLTGTRRLWGAARDAACRFRKEVRERLCLIGTAGVAGNKMVSSIASRIIISEGILDVDHGREAGFMAPLKVTLMPGIGPVRRKVLSDELNIVRIRQLAALDLDRLALIFGSQAQVIHQRALGIDPTPVYPFSLAPVTTEEITLPQEENDDAKLLGHLYRLVEICGFQMRKQGRVPRKAGLLIRYADHVEAGGRLTFSRPNSQDPDLYRPLEKLFFKQCHRRIRVGFLRVWFQDFFPPDPQLPLFPAPSPEASRRATLTRALDRIRERYGQDGVMWGGSAGSRGQGAGGKE